MCSFIAYGQTSTGKTFSMGLDLSTAADQHGIIYRALVDTFELLNEKHDSGNYEVALTFLEIYNERVYDLFNDSKPVQKNALKTDISYVAVESVEQSLQLLQLGNSARHVRPTKLNVNSSRSHAVFAIHVTVSNGEKSTTAGLYLVDLAGSEGVRHTGHEGEALVESNCINQGLLSVGKVLQAMSSKSKLIPYRDSVLTQVLQDSLNANSYVTLLCCINPTEYQGTMSTIRFAQSAKQIKTNPQVNEYFKEMVRGKTPYKTPLLSISNRQSTRNLFYPPLSTVKKPESRHTICTPRKKTRLDFPAKPLNSTTLEPVSGVAEFFHPDNFQAAMEMIRDVPGDQTDMRESINSVATMSVLNVSSSTTKDGAQAMTAVDSTTRSVDLSKIPTMSPILRRIENLESLLDRKFHLLYETLNSSMMIRNNQNLETTTAARQQNEIQELQVAVRSELGDIRLLAERSITIETEEIVEDFLRPKTPQPRTQTTVRRSARLTMMQQNVVVQNEPTTKKNSRKTIGIQKLSKTQHKSNVFSTFKKGSLKELQMLPTIGIKTAQQILTVRSVRGAITTWDDISKLPVWKGNGWKRFMEANLIE